MVGACGIPANAAAVSINLTVVDASVEGEMTAMPATAVAVPESTAISYRAADVRANNAILKLGNGALGFYSRQPSGSAHLILDVNGYFVEGEGAPIAYHAYFPFGEELTPPFQDTEQMKFTGHERDLNNLSSVADDLDYMHARFCSPLTGRFMSVDPVLNVKRAMKKPQNWNRYAYALGNPMKYVDPAGEDISLRISFASSITENERTKIIAQVKAWYERQKVGKVYVFDAARGQHGGNFFSRLFNKGYADIKVSGETAAKHTPGTVFAGAFSGLPADQKLRAISNSIIHETAAHQFGVTLEGSKDQFFYARDTIFANNPAIFERYGTVADSYAFVDQQTRAKVTGGPIPVHPEDAAKMVEDLAPIQVEPPDYE